MTTTDPDQLRREIELTQRGLSADVDALTEKVTPSRIVHRRVNRVRGKLTNLKDTIMGTASDTTDKMGSTASHLADSASSAASSAGQAVSDAPRAIRRQTQGNPLAVGLIGFGLGWLAASLLPPSTPEQHLADQAKDLAQEHLQPAVGDMAEHLKDNLTQPAEHAIESIKTTAHDASTTVADKTHSAAEDVKNHAQHAAGNVKEQANSSSTLS